MKQPLFALIDCNNFFVSCEQIFRPDLAGRAVVVLSSGDGCVVARSNKAKQLGIPMGAPAFKYKRVLNENQVVRFSANFELYGDISRRITEILTSITPRVEVYSIDESFLDISQLSIPDLEEWGKAVRSKIQKWTGVSVSIGIATSKTLAKLAGERAKKSHVLQGVLYIDSSKNEHDHYLEQTSLEDIWGIGWRMAPRLRAVGLSSAHDLRNLTPTQGHKLFGSIIGERLVRELRGQSCIPLERIKVGQRSISATRTFGEDTNQLHVVESALASFVARAAHRLRTQGLVARKLQVFLSSNRHKPGYQKWTKEIVLAQATADTGALTALANRMLSSFHKPGALYHRGGVLLSDLVKNDSFQPDLFGAKNPAQFDKEVRRMKAVDKLNDKYGRRLLHAASEDLSRTWEPKHLTRSPRYTTCWDELAAITIK